MSLAVIGWIALGLFAGLIAGKVAPGRDEWLPMNLALGIAGGVAGGWLFSGPDGASAWSFVTAVMGAAAVLVAWRMIRRSTSHA